LKEKEIELIIKQGEGYLTEFKRGISRELAASICSFANAAGGTILIGIDDNGNAAGVADINRLKSQVMDIARNCDPAVKPEIEMMEYKGVKVLGVNVPEGLHKPYQCSDGFFMRVGANSQKMKSAEILEFISGTGRITFDDVPNRKFDFRKDFDRQKFADYIKSAGISQGINRDVVLQSIGAMENGLLNNAGVLFFAKDPQRFFPQSVYTAMLCKGSDRAHIIDRKEIKGGLFEIVSGVMSFVERNTRLAYRFTGKAKREEIKEYPMEAIREAVINSIAHKYYPEPGHNNILTIYDDRIDIENYWIRPKNYVIGKTVYRRNPIITDMLYRMELGEKSGSGFKRMRIYCAAEKAPYPTLEAEENYFYITFKRSAVYTELALSKTYAMEKEKEIEKVTEKVTERVTGNQAIIIREMDKNRYISAKKLAKIIGISERKIKENIKKLKNIGMVKRVGPDKGGYWEVVKK